MYRFLAISFLFLFVSVNMHAQSNAFLGYSYLNADTSNRSSLNGWNGSLEGKVFPFVGIVADFSGHYGNENFSGAEIHAKQHNFVFGPRVSVTVGKVAPFAHYLVGASHVSLGDSGNLGSDTSFSQAVGGGIDLKFLPLLGWRFQGDFLQTRFFGGTQNNFRFSTGVVLRF